MRETACLRRLVIALCAAVVLTGCVVPVPGPATRAPASVFAASEAPVMQRGGIDGLLNDTRGNRGLAPLRRDGRLDAAARAHAADMASRNYFSHTSPEGGTVGQRVRAQGCSWRRIAENISRGQADEAAAFAGWMRSDGHRRNIEGGYSAYGFARSGDTYVMVFAAGC